MERGTLARILTIKLRRGFKTQAWSLVFVVTAWLLTGCAASKKQPDFPLISEAWNTIQKQYVDRSSVQSTDLTYGAISGMVDALGDTGHSSFLTPDMVQELKRMERGEFRGVGIEIQNKNGRVVVVSPMDDSPAEKAGVHPGDVIVKVGGKDVTEWPLGKVVQQISGRPGTKISLTLVDPKTGRERDLVLTRAAIKLHEVTWQPLPGCGLAHLRIATFDAGVSRDLKRVLSEIQRAGFKGIVLDLRNNPGGLLDEAITVASQFLDSGNVLLARDVKGNVEEVPVEKGGLATKVPIVVLVNEGSASAAEIVAGALQDAGRATLIGETTFGTGTVLEEFKLADGSALLLAVEEWLTPAGHSFWHKGIKPEIMVPLAGDVELLFPFREKGLTSTELETNPDRQLLKAKELLVSGLPAEPSEAPAPAVRSFNNSPQRESSTVRQ